MKKYQLFQLIDKINKYVPEDFELNFIKNDLVLLKKVKTKLITTKGKQIYNLRKERTLFTGTNREIRIFLKGLEMFFELAKEYGKSNKHGNIITL